MRLSLQTHSLKPLLIAYDFRALLGLLVESLARAIAAP